MFFFVFFLWTKHVHTITMCRQVSWPQFCYLFASEFVQTNCFIFYSTLRWWQLLGMIYQSINYARKSVERAQNLVFNYYSNIKLFFAFKHLCSLFLYYFFRTYITSQPNTKFILCKTFKYCSYDLWFLFFCLTEIQTRNWDVTTNCWYCVIRFFFLK